MKAYQAIFAQEAVDTLLRLSRRRRQLILDLVARLAVNPQKPPQLKFELTNGEILAGYVVGQWIVWGLPDHAAREWRVVKLELVK